MTMTFIRMTFLCLLYCIPFAARSATDEPLILKGLTVMADYSLTVPINIISRHYALEHNISITTNLGSTHDHIGEIEEGAEANILIAAKDSWIKELRQKGLIDVYSRRVVAYNKLSLTGSQFAHIIPPLSDRTMIADISDTPQDFLLAMGDAQYTAEGSYGLEVLRYYALLGIMEPYYSFFRNMGDLVYAQKDSDTLGIMFYSDALLFPQIKSLQIFPAQSHAAITYQAVVIAGENMEEARDFVSYLEGEYAQGIFKQFGFDL